MAVRASVCEYDNYERDRAAVLFAGTVGPYSKRVRISFQVEESLKIRKSRRVAVVIVHN